MEAKDKAISKIIASALATHETIISSYLALAENEGISLIELKALEALRASPGLSAGDLALRTKLTASSATSLIDRLEKRRLVRRVRDHQDRRKVVVELTLIARKRLNENRDAMVRGIKLHLEERSKTELLTLEVFVGSCQKSVK